jgi:hypothetical protein
VLDESGGYGGGVAPRAAVHMVFGPARRHGVELAVDPRVENPAGAEMLDWMPPETRSAASVIPLESEKPGVGSPGVSGMAAPAAPDENARSEAFATYVLPEVEVLLRVAYTLVPRPADAEDLVQDTRLRAFGSIDSFDGSHPRAWLLTIMRNFARLSSWSTWAA